MSTTLGTFKVFNYEVGAHRDIDLVEGLDNAHFDKVDQEWAGPLTTAHVRAKLAHSALPPGKQSEALWQTMQATFGAPDSHWNWRKKYASLRPASQRLVALLEGTSVEALMLIDLSGNSRLAPKPVTQIVYVENIAVAPWNRTPIQSPPRYRNLGKLLIGVAVAISQQEHLDGRCGLHSLVQSEGFYKKLGMTDLGLDPKVENLRYFEFDPTSANTFLGGP